MQWNTAENISVLLQTEASTETAPEQTESGEVTEIRQSIRERESLSENFNHELEAWARHSIARNGFGDY